MLPRQTRGMGTPPSLRCQPPSSAWTTRHDRLRCRLRCQPPFQAWTHLTRMISAGLPPRYRARAFYQVAGTLPADMYGAASGPPLRYPNRGLPSKLVPRKSFVCERQPIVLRVKSPDDHSLRAMSRSKNRPRYFKGGAEEAPCRTRKQSPIAIARICAS